LKYLFQLADLLGLKITLRPGPYGTNERRNGGYPDWLRRRPEYRMSQQSILEGRYPRWSALQYEHSEEAATEWLKNETHLIYVRKYSTMCWESPLLSCRPRRSYLVGPDG
jgi:beta-galactosidase GanA